VKKLLYIYNPTAGRKTAKMNLSDALEVFTRQGYEITVRPTQARGDAAAAVRDLGPEFDRVVCSGGDGTLNETVRGILALPEAFRNRKLEIIVLPAGEDAPARRDGDVADIVRSLVGAVPRTDLTLSDLRDERLRKYEAAD